MLAKNTTKTSSNPSIEWLAEMAVKIRAAEGWRHPNVRIGKRGIYSADAHFAKRAFDYHKAAAKLLEKMAHSERLAGEEARIQRAIEKQLTVKERSSARIPLTRAAKFVTNDEHKDRALTKFWGFVDLLNWQEGFWGSKMPNFKGQGLGIEEVSELRAMWEVLDYKSAVRKFLSDCEKNYLTRPLPEQSENQPPTKKSRPEAAKKRPRRSRRPAK